MSQQTPLEKAVQAAGSKSELARRIGVTYQSIQQWDQIPADRIVAIEEATGIPREELRPDLYRHPDHPEARA